MNQLKSAALTNTQIKNHLEKLDFNLNKKIDKELEFIFNLRIQLSSANKSSINLVYPTYLKLIKHLKTDDNDSRIYKFKELLLNKFNEKLVKKIDHKVACFLTPYFKNLFNNKEVDEITTAIKLENSNDTLLNNSSSNNLLAVDSPNIQSTNNCFFSDIVVPNSVKKRSTNEIEIYLNMDFYDDIIIDKTIMFWSKKKHIT